MTAHDSNGAVPVLSAYRSGSASVVKLNLGRKAAANRRVSCGAARTSLGPNVLKDNTGYHLPADVFIDFPVPSP